MPKRKHEAVTPTPDASACCDFVCTICYELLYEPVRLSCGHAFCKLCLSKWLSSTDGKLTCPLDRSPTDGLPAEIDEGLKAQIVKASGEEYLRRGTEVDAEKREIFRDVVDYLRTRSHANARLVANLRRVEGSTLRAGTPLEAALLDLPRGEFVPPLYRCQAYSMQHPLHVTSLRYNMSSAVQQVQCLGLLDIPEGASVLDVGTGGGAVAALAAHLTTHTGVVHAIDVRPLLVGFAKQNIQAQAERVRAVRRMQQQGLAAGHPVYRDLVPGVVHEGHINIRVPESGACVPQAFYLFVESLCTTASEFTGKICWPHRGKTLTFCKGEVSLGDDGACTVVITESQVHVTRCTWNQLDWLPARYTLEWSSNNVLRGTDAAGNAISCKVADRSACDRLPDFSHVVIREANVLDAGDMKGLLAQLPPPGGYDRIHCGCECSEAALEHILQYLKVGGTMVTHIDGYLSVVTRFREGYDIDKKVRVCQDPLLSVSEANERKSLDVRDASDRASERACAQGTYCSRCCGEPLCATDQEIDIASVIGCSLEVADSSGMLFSAGSAQSGLSLDSAANDFVSIPLLSGRVAPVRCRACSLSVGVWFTRPPPEKRGTFDWQGSLLLSSSLVELRHDARPAAPPAPSPAPAAAAPEDAARKCRPVVGGPATTPRTEICCASKRCGKVLAQPGQLLSCRYKWRTNERQPPEPAAYFNSLRPGATREGDPTEMTLSQGRMTVSLLYCTGCGEEVGWRFVSHLVPAQRHGLLFHEGRCGLVMSKVTGLRVAPFPRIIIRAFVPRPPASLLL